MKSETDDSSIEALKNLLSEVDLILSTTAPLPENRTPRCRELLSTAIALADDLPRQVKDAPAAVLLGHKGGSVTAKRHGAEHYRMMAAARKTHAGGRPRKEAR
jgi:hypothetical protein